MSRIDIPTPTYSCQPFEVFTAVRERLAYLQSPWLSSVADLGRCVLNPPYGTLQALTANFIVQTGRRAVLVVAAQQRLGDLGLQLHRRLHQRALVNLPVQQLCNAFVGAVACGYLPSGCAPWSIISRTPPNVRTEKMHPASNVRKA
jgi:hypothetical protein